MTEFIEIIKAIIFGVVEGITEWLPVSSTGHLILLDEFLSLNVAPELGATFAEEYMSMFEVVIQLGAILAVVVMFFSKLNPFAPSKSALEKKNTWVLWLKVVIASIPAALIGIVGDKILEKITGKDIDGWIYNWVTVAVALIVYGVLFIVVERWQKNKPVKVNSVEEISYSQALLVGCFQTLSIVPGTSRSGSTILGARTIGISRPAAAEFSFYLAIPTMAGASLLKGVKFFLDGNTISGNEWLILLVGCLTAFAVSLMVIRYLMDYVRRHSFSVFGVYRIVLGAVVLGYFLLFR